MERNSSVLFKIEQQGNLPTLLIRKDQNTLFGRLSFKAIDINLDKVKLEVIEFLRFPWHEFELWR